MRWPRVVAAAVLAAALPASLAQAVSPEQQITGTVAAGLGLGVAPGGEPAPVSSVAYDLSVQETLEGTVYTLTPR